MKRGEANGFNVYTSVLPVKRQESKVYDRIWVDMDNPEAPWPFGADPNWKHAAWPKPTTLVKTSDTAIVEEFRWQAIWRLKNELPEVDARDLMKRLAALAGADASVHDPRRVLRVPGILNAKRGQMARLIDTSTETVSIEAFDLPRESEVEKLLNAPINNPKHVLGEWLQGTEEGDRSRKAYVAARFLKSCQVDWADAAAILKLGAVRSTPPLEDNEVQHALDSAYHRQG